MIIYLDQNKWIDLAKAIMKPEKYPKYVDVAKLIEEKAKREEWIFPLSVIHVFETVSREEKESRKRLVDVMVNISNGYSIKSFLDVQKIELMNIFLEICNSKKIKQVKAIVKNPLVAIGAENMIIDLKTDLIPPDIKKELLSIIETHLNNNISNKDISNIILDNHDKEFIEGLRSDDAIITAQLKKDRDNLLKLPKQHRYNIFLIQRFWGLIKHLNINIEELCKDNEDHLISSLKDKIMLLNS